MWQKVGIYLGNFIVKFVLPYLFKEAKKIIEDAVEANKVEKAYATSSDEAKKKYDEALGKPGLTAKEKANAIRDLLSAHPDL